MKTLELIEKSLKKNSTQQLISKLEKLNENSQEFEVIISILEKRGQDVSKWKKDEKQEEVVVYQSEEELTQEEREILEKIEDKEQSLRDRLIEEVDQFMDELIAGKRTGVNLEVLKALGGQYGSDLDELLENASIERLKDALSFKNLKQKAEKVKKEKNGVIKIKQKIKEVKNIDYPDGFYKDCQISFIYEKTKEKKEGIIVKIFFYKKTNKNCFIVKDNNGHIYYKSLNSVKLL